MVDASLTTFLFLAAHLVVVIGIGGIHARRLAHINQRLLREYAIVLEFTRGRRR